MAGSGTDIQLGGNAEMRMRLEIPADASPETRAAQQAAIQAEVTMLKEKALAAGGLYILATERHESRRIDNQLRGRGGRQGDPGQSKFYLSLQDDLMRIFGSERMDSMLRRLGLQPDEAIIHPWINKAVEKAQQKVEARNFDMRKNVLKFDNVMNDQRKVIFEDRRRMMAQESLEPTISEMRAGVIDDLVARHIPPDAYPEAWDIKGLSADIKEKLNLEPPVEAWAKEEGIADEEIAERLHKAADAAYAERVERNTPDLMRFVEKQIILQALDHLWREHLVTLDHLRQVIGWRGMAQRDPLNEYKQEAFELFQQLIAHWHEQVTSQMMRVEVRIAPQEPTPPPTAAPAFAALNGAQGLNGAQTTQFFDEASAPRPEDLETTLPSAGRSVMAALSADAGVALAERGAGPGAVTARVGRNEPCPCGSGKKFKHCHGALA
jgi:preprotein translocase subunit SecA